MMKKNLNYMGNLENKKILNLIKNLWNSKINIKLYFHLIKDVVIHFFLVWIFFVVKYQVMFGA